MRPESARAIFHIKPLEFGILNKLYFLYNLNFRETDRGKDIPLHGGVRRLSCMTKWRRFDVMTSRVTSFSAKDKSQTEHFLTKNVDI